MTALSMKFSSSRTLPGHDQLTKARMVSDGIFSICRLIHFVGVLLREVPGEDRDILGMIA